MTKQDRADLQKLIDEAQAAITKAVEFAREIVDETDDEGELDALNGLVDELDTQLPAVSDYFPEDSKP
jgi:hypothetical protein